jgi:hypothetical protein
MSSSELDSSNNIGRKNKARTSMVALQHLYSDFLPPPLQLNEEAQKKRQKMNNRPAVYTGLSWTLQWWRDASWGKAAKGSRKLDAGFITV